jgi:hypothetical protein
MEEKKKKVSIILNLTKTEIVIFLVVGIFLVFIPVLFTWSNISWISFKETGPIGDTIGGITAPFIGFGGSILVYLALKAQIDANTKIQDQFNEQKKNDYKQNFENTFFNLLSIHHQIIQDIDYYLDSIYVYKEKNYRSIFHKTNFIEDKITKSRDVFKNSFKLLYMFMKHDADSLLNKKPEREEILQAIFLMNGINYVTKNGVNINTKLNEIYHSFYIKYDTDFGHYFRNLYRLVKIVDEKNFDSNLIEDYKIKYSYTSIVRSQLSDAEIKWLFFNCLSEKGFQKFKPLIEKYTLLKNINIDDDVFNFYSNFYIESAFVNPKSNSSILQHINKDFYSKDIIPDFSKRKISVTVVP